MVIEQGSELQAGASREDVSMEGDKPREPTSAEVQLNALFTSLPSYSSSFRVLGYLSSPPSSMT